MEFAKHLGTLGVAWSGTDLGDAPRGVTNPVSQNVGPKN
jgi:hypothetical protein